MSFPKASFEKALTKSLRMLLLMNFQAQKLRVDLALVRGNLTVMTEMLNQLTPGQSQQEDSELLQVGLRVFLPLLPLYSLSFSRSVSSCGLFPWLLLSCIQMRLCHIFQFSVIRE